MFLPSSCPGSEGPWYTSLVGPRSLYKLRGAASTGGVPARTHSAKATRTLDAVTGTSLFLGRLDIHCLAR